MKTSLSLRAGLVLACFFAVARAADNPAPAGQAELLAESLPHIESWRPAVFPKELPAEVTSGSAMLRLIIDDTGNVDAIRVVSATEPAFGEAAVEAVKQWKFTPGVDNGKRAAMSVDITVDFPSRTPEKPGLFPPDSSVPKASPRTPVVVKHAPLGEYPATVRERGIPGIVLFRCVVGADGRARDLSIVGATHADFVLPAITAFQSWEFSPAKAGDLPADAEVSGEIMFGELTANRAETLAKNGITALDGSAPVDQPMPRIVVDPVWPYDLLLKGEGGFAVLEFTVMAHGHVTDVKSVEASHPDFGAAAVFAMVGWRFDPALRDGQGVEVRLRRRVEFAAVPLDAQNESDPLTRVVRVAREGSIRGGVGLDSKLTPLYRAVPIVPPGPDGETKLTGEAKIELVIDRDGHVRLPRVTSATHPSLGWAAATAVGQWVFKAPTRAGTPTEVKVLLPIKF